MTILNLRYELGRYNVCRTENCTRMHATIVGDINIVVWKGYEVMDVVKCKVPILASQAPKLVYLHPFP